MSTKDQTSRRTALGLIIGLPTLTTLPAAALATSDSELVRLGAELARNDREREAFAAINPDADDPFFTEHWALREKINAIPARGPQGLAAKAFAVEQASKYDTFHECEGSGSFVDLALSICKDIAIIAAVSAEVDR